MRTGAILAPDESKLQITLEFELSELENVVAGRIDASSITTAIAAYRDLCIDAGLRLDLTPDFDTRGEDDAESDPPAVCGEPSPRRGRGCSLEPGHSGAHHAYRSHDLNGYLTERWVSDTLDRLGSVPILMRCDGSSGRYQCSLRDVHGGPHRTYRAHDRNAPEVEREFWGMHERYSACDERHPYAPLRCSRPTRHEGWHEAYARNAVDDDLIAEWVPEPRPSPRFWSEDVEDESRCGSEERGYACSLPAGHGRAHEAWRGHRIDDGGTMVSSWADAVSPCNADRAGHVCNRELWHGGDHRDYRDNLWSRTRDEIRESSNGRLSYLLGASTELLDAQNIIVGCNSCNPNSACGQYHLALVESDNRLREERANGV